MNAITNVLSELANKIPMIDILNYFFKYFLSKYLEVNNVNLSEIEKNFSSKKYINLNNLSINALYINENYLLTNPLKILQGKAGKFVIESLNNKIKITLEDIDIILIPVYNYDNMKINQINLSKNYNINNNKNNSNANNNKKNETFFTNMTNKIISYLNNILNKIEINVNNLCVRITTVEPTDNVFNIPVISFFLVNFKIFNDKKDENNNFFLNGLNIELNKMCMKVENKFDYLSCQEFFKLCKSKDEEKLKLFFKQNNTIFIMNYLLGPNISIIISYIEKNLNISVNLSQTEFILTPSQLHNIIIFYRVYSLINNVQNFQIENSKLLLNANKKVETKINESKIEKNDKNNNNNNNINNNTINNENNTNKSTDLLGYEINKYLFELNLNKFLIILYENTDENKILKIASFFNSQENEDIYKHFCYFHDNFIHISIENLSLNTEEKLKIENILFNYVNYKGILDKKKITNNNKNNFLSSTTSIYESCDGLSDEVFKSCCDSNSFLEITPNTDDLLKQEYAYSIFNIIKISELEILNYKDIQINEFNFNFHFIILFLFTKIYYQNNKFPNSFKDLAIVDIEKTSRFYLEKVIEIKEEEEEENLKKTNKQIYSLNINEFNFKIYNFILDKYRNDGADIEDYFFNYYYNQIFPFLNIKNYNIYCHQENLNLKDIISNDYVLIKFNNFYIKYDSNPLKITINLEEIFFDYITYNVIYYKNNNFNKENSYIIKYSPNKNQQNILIKFKDDIFGNLEYIIIQNLLFYSYDSNCEWIYYKFIWNKFIKFI